MAYSDKKYSMEEINTALHTTLKIVNLLRTEKGRSFIVSRVNEFEKFTSNVSAQARITAPTADEAFERLMGAIKGS